MSTRFPIFVNGEVHPASTAVVSAEDEGFLLGLAVFETMLVEGGHIGFFDEHLERLRSGAVALGIPWPAPWDVRTAIAEVVGRVDERRLAVRITYSRGVAGRPTLVVSARRIEPPPPGGVRVAVASLRLLAGDSLGGLKSTNRLRYVLAREEARERGAWEALLLNHEGDLAEGTVSNVFAVIDGELLTPSLGSGGLGGIVRGRILTELEHDPLVSADGTPIGVRAGRLAPERLASASEVFLTNSTGGVISVREVLGLGEIPLVFAGDRGEVTRAAAERLSAAEERDRRTTGNPDSGCG